MPEFGINSEKVKKINRGLALKYIACEENCTRSFIVNKSGLSRMAVTNIVNGLIEDGYVVEAENEDAFAVFSRSLPGKKPAALKISQKAPKVIGLYISRTKLVASLSTLECFFEGTQTYFWKKEDKNSIINKVLEFIHLLEKNANGNILGVGIAAIGPLDATTGDILNPISFFGIDVLNIKFEIENRTPYKAKLINDMDASALSEVMFGKGKDVRDFVYLGLSNGIGAGIVSNGKLFQNALRHAGEIGHMSINFDGPRCVCGNYGCLEVYINIPVLLEKINRISDTKKHSEKDLNVLYSKTGFRSIFDDFEEKLSVGIINICNALDPEIIFIGHDAVYFPKIFFEKLERKVNRRVFYKTNQSIKIYTSAFGEDSPLAGAICTVLNDLFLGEVY